MNSLEQHRAAQAFFREHPGEAFDESKGDVAFSVESMQSALSEMQRLFQAHWDEIALDHDAVKLDVDYDLYAELEASNQLHIVTARDDGWLVGYHVSVIRPHPHYKSTVHCLSDIFYLKPEYRNGLTGYRLLKFFRDSVLAKGVTKILISTKLTIDTDPLMRRLGFKPIERVYSFVAK